MAKKRRFFTFQRIFIIILGTSAVLYALQLYYSQRSKFFKYASEIDKLNKEKALLEETLRKVESPFMTEKIAREQMGMMKKGEYKIQFKKEGENVSH